MTLFSRAFDSFGAKSAATISTSDVTIDWNRDVTVAGFPGYQTAYARMYAQQLWVWTVVNKLARGIGRLPLKVYKTKAGKRERVTGDDPLYALLQAPAPRMAPTHFKQALVTDTAIYGNTMVLRVARNARVVPSQLIPVSAVGWAQREDGTWEWSDPATGKLRQYEPWQVMHFHHYTPGRPTDWAVSPLEPLRLTLAIEYAAQRLGVAAFQNGGRPSGVLTTDQDLNKEKIAKLRDSIQQIHGGVGNWFKTAILTNGLKWQTMSWNLNDSAVVEHRKLTREEVAAAYDVPPPMIGILDRATFSNIDTQSRMLYTDTLGPWLTMIEETLEGQLIAGNPALEGYSLEFDLNEVLKGDTTARFTAYTQAITAGWAKQNEVRGWENLEAVEDEDADRLHRPMNLTPFVARATTPPASPPGNGE